MSKWPYRDWEGCPHTGAPGITHASSPTTGLTACGRAGCDGIFFAVRDDKMVTCIMCCARLLKEEHDAAVS